MVPRISTVSPDAGSGGVTLVMESFLLHEANTPATIITAKKCIFRFISVLLFNTKLRSLCNQIEKPG
jgi:hypothetical protein